MTKLPFHHAYSKLFCMAFALAICTSCAVEPVKPWEKGTLASEEMRFGGPNPMIKKFDEHIFTSKESTKGGGGVAGGGCGCN